MRILLLVDLPYSPPSDPTETLFDADWKTEREVCRALRSLGHSVRVAAIHDDIRPLLTALKENPPDLVFNLVEEFGRDHRREPDVAALLELLKVRFTGSGSVGLRSAKNKGLAKELLAAAGIPTPRFRVVKPGASTRSGPGLRFPLIVKPAEEDASYGISQASIVRTAPALAARVRFVHRRLGQAALIEEYVHGRELYVGILGGDPIHVFPARELGFGRTPASRPRIATFRAKWDRRYRRAWGIASGFARLRPAVAREARRLAAEAFRALGLRGYARIDFRLAPNGALYVIEANPNPGIARDEEMPRAAAKAGLPYDAFIARIVELARPV